MNQLFTSLYEQVVVNTNRPNLVAETKSAIVAATKELHNRGKFLADIREVLLTSTNGGSTSYKFVIPPEKLIREILNVSPATQDCLKGVSLEKISPFEPPKCGNWYSWLHNVITIGVSHPASTFAISYLSFPDTREDLYDSWIAVKYPHFVTDAASFRVLTMAGQSPQANIYKGLVGEARIPGSHIFNLLQENEEIK